MPKKKQPLGLDKNVKKRPQFAKEHIHKNPNFCHMIAWTYESKLNVFGSDAKQRRPPNKQLNLKYTKNIVKHGDASIMIWSCFTASWLGLLVQIEGIMNGEIYRDIPRNLSGQ